MAAVAVAVTVAAVDGVSVIVVVSASCSVTVVVDAAVAMVAGPLPARSRLRFLLGRFLSVPVLPSQLTVRVLLSLFSLLFVMLLRWRAVGIAAAAVSAIDAVTITFNAGCR